MKIIGMIFILLMFIGGSQVMAEDYLLDYEHMYNNIEAHEKFCENNQQREFAEDVCYEYNVNQAMKNGVYTVEEMKQIKEEWLKYYEEFR